MKRTHRSIGKCTHRRRGDRAGGSVPTGKAKGGDGAEGSIPKGGGGGRVERGVPRRGGVMAQYEHTQGRRG